MAGLSIYAAAINLIGQIAKESGEEIIPEARDEEEECIKRYFNVMMAVHEIGKLGGMNVLKILDFLKRAGLSDSQNSLLNFSELHIKKAQAEEGIQPVVNLLEWRGNHADNPNH